LLWIPDGFSFPGLVSSNTPILIPNYLVTPFCPEAVPGTSKYGPSGLFTSQSFAYLTTDSIVASTLSHLANHSITRNTWSTYQTANRMLKLCFDSRNTIVSYPLSQGDLLIFISWLNNRGLSPTTISSYLSGIRLIHLTVGLEAPDLRSDIVSQVLTGAKHINAVSIKSKPVRMPITPTILRLLKLAISRDDLCPPDCRMYWFLCTLAFHGSFRMGELLCLSPLHFDPNYALLSSDLKLTSTVVNKISTPLLEVTLKSTKSSLTSAVMIDLFPTNNDLCPLRAYSKCPAPTSQALPMFRLSTGKLITTRQFNVKLKYWLKDYLDFSVTTVSGHSFRAGIPSIMSSLGCPDDDLKTIGRWSSRAFKFYTKLPRTNRLAMAKALGDLKL